MELIEKIRISTKYEQIMEHDKWMREIPFLQFPPHWSIQIIPPFAGAVIRYKVKAEGVVISVYLDCYARLGACNEPYWEIYPASDGDCERFYLNQTDDLLKAIQDSINTHARSRSQSVQTEGGTK